MFETNPDREFYIEESLPLNRMYPSRKFQLGPLLPKTVEGGQSMERQAHAVTAIG